MAQKYTLSYLQYINESEDITPLKGYTADLIITRIGELMEVLPDKVRFGIPSDFLGRNITYRDANGAIERIRDILNHYNKEDIRFYCWSVAYTGTWAASKSLRNKIESTKAFGENNTNLNLKDMVNYFTQNAEDADNIASISINIDALSIRKAMNVPVEPEAINLPAEPTADVKKPEGSEKSQPKAIEGEI